jgi:glutathione reductase (NADPH)
MKPDTQFDLIVIGTGAAGSGVAVSCAEAGWKVAIVDALPYGGTCMLRGCDPKKMLLAVTEGKDWIERMHDKGLQASNAGIDWRRAIAFKRSFTERGPARMESWFRSAGVTTLHGTARFLDSGVLLVGDQTFHTKYAHIASGARPVTLNIPGEEYLASSTDFLELEALPPRIVFIGGGFIAFEFAHISKRAGAREVTILQRGARPLVQFDSDMVDLQVTHSREMGIDLRCEAQVTGISRQPAGFAVEYNGPGGSETVHCDLVVHGAGRVPNLDDLDPAAAGIETTRKGIRVDSFLRSTSNPAVFAAGDCADSGAPNLTPVAALEGRVVTKNLLAEDNVQAVHYPPVPSLVFTLPAVARVGLLEDEARQQGLDFETRFENTRDWYSSLRVGERYSAYKILVENGSGRILGAHLIGPGAEEQINLLAMGMAAGLSVEQFKTYIFAYPSYASDLSSML